MTNIQTVIDKIEEGTATDEDVALACGWTRVSMDNWHHVGRMVVSTKAPQFLTGPEWDLSSIVNELPEGYRLEEVRYDEECTNGKWLAGIVGKNEVFLGLGTTPKAAACIAMLRARMEVEK